MAEITDYIALEVPFRLNWGLNDTHFTFSQYSDGGASPSGIRAPAYNQSGRELAFRLLTAPIVPTNDYLQVGAGVGRLLSRTYELSMPVSNFTSVAQESGTTWEGLVRINLARWDIRSDGTPAVGPTAAVPSRVTYESGNAVFLDLGYYGSRTCFEADATEDQKTGVLTNAREEIYGTGRSIVLAMEGCGENKLYTHGARVAVGYYRHLFDSDLSVGFSASLDYPLHQGRLKFHDPDTGNSVAMDDLSVPMMGLNIVIGFSKFPTVPPPAAPAATAAPTP